MLLDHLRAKQAAWDAAGLRRTLRVAAGAVAPHQVVAREAGSPPEPRLLFCSNDYLGLAGDARVAEALAEGARHWGAGAGASHLVSGHMQPHEDLEADLAAWLAPLVPGGEVLTFSSGYAANTALLTTLGDAAAELFCEQLNHASLIDGARLARAPVQRYAHGDVPALARLLAASRAKVKLIVTDAVFSMDGDCAPLPGLLALAEQHDAWLVVDDAHGLGVLGEGGRGTLAHFGLASERLILMGTLGKALGVAGAFVLAHPTVVGWLRQAARPYVYTTAPPPALACAVRAAIAIAAGPEGDARRAHLRALQASLRSGLSRWLAQGDHGWTVLPGPTPIVPLVVGRNEVAVALAAALDARGLRVPAIRPPTVAVGSARLRITLCAAHRAADVPCLLDALAAASLELAHGIPTPVA